MLFFTTRKQGGPASHYQPSTYTAASPAHLPCTRPIKAMSSHVAMLDLRASVPVLRASDSSMLFETSAQLIAPRRLDKVRLLVFT
jgi:hypothetical protein